ncbi:AMP-binding protein [Sphingomonas jeddahensis]|uniref:Long-chain-fatty-acid--CoA ligase FadD15 n=1 Tax=Sphingomonas jeddahensis TaxID=1915074 RepID=A0A1V2ETA0_9SPHN|nr:AMP-binding protein [Sphingomonas jeddahensis]ONF95389.1 Long-chain-fatty-acid--CoA ligase FadD15 [Sphingomonas jeddahensis]
MLSKEVRPPEDAITAMSLPWSERAVTVEHREDGCTLLRSPYVMRDTPRSIAHLFLDRVAERPDHPFIQQRGKDGTWRGPTYAEMETRARGIGQWLLDHGAGGTGGVMILSGNSVDHAAVMLGCYLAGVPSTALSQAYSLGASDFTKLRHCLATVAPRVIFVQSGDAFAPALAEIRALRPDMLILSGDGTNNSISLDQAAATPPTAALDEALGALDHSTVAKYLFTSGSTGMPKAVPQTHGMMAAMVAARHGLMADPDERFPAISVDWMPWSHLSAGNIGFNHNIWAGGTLYLDDGRPMPGQFATTLRNLLELKPPLFSSAPIAFEMLVSALENDRQAAADLLPGLRYMSYGGAALSQNLADRVQQLALDVTGRTIPIITTYGATEVQGITTVHWDTTKVGMIGLPVPGVTLKLTPVGDKLEVRVKGQSVMAGYLNEPEKNAEAFDEEGYYCLGDAARFVDPEDPSQGVAFDGRISEDFKLTSGTWVSVGTLRAAIVTAASPHLRDLVITGQDRPFIGGLAWLAGNDPDAVVKLREALTAFNRQAGGSSRRIARLLILAEPPSISDGEITEKGYINQRAVLARRAAEVERLYAAEPDADVILLD